jgi:tetratricopeptide (TPR) repeat protein
MVAVDAELSSHYTPPAVKAPVYKPTQPSWWQAVGLPGLVLVAAVLLVYLPALRAGFIWDDDVHFSANPRMLTLGGLVDIWTSRFALYYPLTSTTFWLLRQTVGLVPWIYHLVNILMHAGAVLLVWRVWTGLGLRGAWLGALLFALHPVQVESVAWISELKNTQSLVFLMLSMLALQRSGLLPDNQWRNPRAYRWALVWYFCALMSKSSVATFPAVLLVLLWWKNSLRGRAGWTWILPFLLPALLFAGWTIWEQRYNSGAAGFEWSVALADRLVTSARLVIFYFNKLLWPAPLIFIYPALDLSASDLRSWMPLLALVVVAVMSLVNVKTWGRPVLAAGLIYGLLLFPVLGFFNVYFMRYANVADHFQYLASLAPLALAGAVLQAGLDGLRAAAPSAVMPFRFLIAAGVTVLAVAAQRHVPVFRENETLWRDTVEKNPQAWMAQNNLGLLYMDRGEWEPAARHLRAALLANPQHYEALNNLGNVLFQMSDWSGAQSCYERALALQPRLLVSHINLGSVHEKAGRLAEAEQCYRAALELGPDAPDAHARLAQMLEAQDRIDEAIKHFILALQATTPEVGEHLKFIQQQAARMLSERRWRAARMYLEAAEPLAPSDPTTAQLRDALVRLQRESEL